MLYSAQTRDCPDFLPVTAEDANKLTGDSAVDFVLISGDAYVDHPSFGAAIIGKLLYSLGCSVGIVPQPRGDSDYKVFGRPKLAFLITSGNVDSMVNHYTAAKRKRSNDYYSPGGKAGRRPDRALAVYTRRARAIYGDVPVILGGLEASLRRLAHYDYWSDTVRKSILVESGADLLVYGMGEGAIAEAAAALSSGKNIRELTDIAGTVYLSDKCPEDAVILPSYVNVSRDTKAYADSFKIQLDNADFGGKTLCEDNGGIFAVQNPPRKPLTTPEMDYVYSLNYARVPHPMYEADGGVPATLEVRFSVTSHRGCFGGCSFCALHFHQGRSVTKRSRESIIEEVKKLTKLQDFKGYIHDVGGPSANFRNPPCDKMEQHGACPGKRCLVPRPCANLRADHSDYFGLLRELRAIPGIKKVFVRSGIRYDYMLLDKHDYVDELCIHHVSGQLKVAPEHVSDKVLALMGKPGRAVFDKFRQRYAAANKSLGKEQYLVPYLMSSHPGAGLAEAVELAEYLRDNRIFPEQAQDFYPTPGTVSTCMYHTGLDPFTGAAVYSAKRPEDKAMQRALVQYWLPQNRGLVIRALTKAGREDLIGFDKKCLVRPGGEYKKPAPVAAKTTGRADVKLLKPTKKKTIRNVHKKIERGI